MEKRPNQGEDEAMPNLCPIDSQNHEPCAEWRGPDLSGSLQGAGGIGGLLARTDMGQWIAGSSFATTFYHSDANGNVTSMVYPNGFLAAKYLYDPFGNMLAQSGSLASANRYRFSSKEWDSNSGLYYYLYRFYDPNLQRWPNKDPIGEIGGINLFTYVANNPIKNQDYWGFDCASDCENQHIADNKIEHDYKVCLGWAYGILGGSQIIARPRPPLTLPGILAGVSACGAKAIYAQDVATAKYLGCLSGCPHAPYCLTDPNPYPSKF